MPEWTFNDDHMLPTRSQTSSESENSKETLLYEHESKSRDASLYSSRSQESVSILDREPVPPPPSTPQRAVSIECPKKYEAYKDVLTPAELQVKIADLGNACWTVI